MGCMLVCSIKYMQHQLTVPTTNLNEGDLQQHQSPEGTFRELSKQGELFKDILQRVILPA